MLRLRISKHDEKHIQLEALEGIDHFGFGTFLCNIFPNQIECDAFSKKVLIESNYQDGLNGLEIWPDNRIAWGSKNHKIIMPISEISKESGSDDWLTKITIKK